MVGQLNLVEGFERFRIWEEMIIQLLVVNCPVGLGGNKPFEDNLQNLSKDGQQYSTFTWQLLSYFEVSHTHLIFILSLYNITFCIISLWVLLKTFFFNINIYKKSA